MRYGKWIDPVPEGVMYWDERAYQQCSLCGKKQFLPYGMKYCPHCGARMGEEAFTKAQEGIKMKEKLTSTEIIKVLDTLIGPTEAIGDSAADHAIEHNLMILIDIVNWCLDGVSDSASTRHRFEGSMRDVGERAFAALDEWRNWLDERIKED